MMAMMATTAATSGAYEGCIPHFGPKNTPNAIALGNPEKRASQSRKSAWEVW